MNSNINKNQNNESKRQIKRLLKNIKGTWEGINKLKDELLELYTGDVELMNLLAKIREEPSVKSIEQQITANLDKISTENQEPPLQQLQQNCSQAIEHLNNSSISICVYGNHGSGKTTFCNLLMGDNIENRITPTCFPTIIFSGKPSPYVKLYFYPSIKIEEIFANAEEKRPEMKEFEKWEKFKNLIISLYNSKQNKENGFVTICSENQLPILHEVPIAIRSEKIIEKMEMKHPIMGIDLPGIKLIDCPGLQLNPNFTNAAKSKAQQSEIIYYVMNSFNTISDEEAQFLGTQAKNGSSVLFIYNFRRVDNASLHQEKLNFIQSKIRKWNALDSSPLFKVNLSHCYQQLSTTYQHFPPHLHFQFHSYSVWKKLNTTVSFIQLHHKFAPLPPSQEEHELEFPFHAKYEEEDVEEEEMDAGEEMGEVLESKKKERKRRLKQINEIYSGLMIFIENKRRGAITFTARSIYQVLQSNYLLVCKLISYLMKNIVQKPPLDSKASSSSSKLLNNNPSSTPSTTFGSIPPGGNIGGPNGNNNLAIDENINQLKLEIKQLIKQADGLIDNYKKELRELYDRTLEKLSPKLREKARVMKVNVKYDPADKSKFWFFQKSQTEFEKQLFESLIQEFTTEFIREYYDWLASKRIQFSKDILEKAHGIQESANLLRNQLSQFDVSTPMNTLFINTEKQLGKMLTAQIAIAGPIFSVFLAGAGFAVPWLLFGVASTVLLAGSVVILAGASITGMIGGIISILAIQKNSIKSEDEFRENIYSTLKYNLSHWRDSKNFKSFENESMNYFYNIKSFIHSNLLLSVLQIQSLSVPPTLSLSSSPSRSPSTTSTTSSSGSLYESLCHFLYARDKLSNVLVDLSNLLSNAFQVNKNNYYSEEYLFQLEMNRNLTSIISSIYQKQAILKGQLGMGNMIQSPSSNSLENNELKLKCTYPECFICKKEFSNCNHVCPSCKYTLHHTPLLLSSSPPPPTSTTSSTSSPSPSSYSVNPPSFIKYFNPHENILSNHQNQYCSCPFCTVPISFVAKGMQQESPGALLLSQSPSISESLQSSNENHDKMRMTSSGDFQFKFNELIELNELSSTLMENNYDAAAPSASPSFLPSKSNEKLRLLKHLSNFQKLFDNFADWFNINYSKYDLHVTAARSVVSRFISNFIGKLSNSQDLPEFYRKLIIECLHELIYPKIYQTLFTPYKFHFEDKDKQVYEAMSSLRSKPIEFYQGDIKWSKSSHENFQKAIELLKEFDRSPIPLQKLNILKECYIYFEKSIPPTVSVGGDLLVPVLLYFLVESNIPHFHALFALISDALYKTNIIDSDEEYLFDTIQSLVVDFPQIVAHFNARAEEEMPLRVLVHGE